MHIMHNVSKFNLIVNCYLFIFIYFFLTQPSESVNASSSHADPAGAGHSYRDGILPPQGCPCPRVFFVCVCVYTSIHTHTPTSNMFQYHWGNEPWTNVLSSKTHTTDENHIHYFPQFCYPFFFSSKWINIDPWTWRGLCCISFSSIDETWGEVGSIIMAPVDDSSSQATAGPRNRRTPAALSAWWWIHQRTYSLIPDTHYI